MSFRAFRYDLGHEPSLDPPEPKPLFPCDDCGDSIFQGDDYFEICGMRFCTECIEDRRRTAEEGDE